MDTSVSGVGVLDKAVAVLSALEAGPLTMAEVMAATDLPRATAHRLVHALEQHGLVVRADGDRRLLGPRLAQLGAAATADRPLVEAARPVLERLRDETEESVQLYVRQGASRLCVAALESPHGLRTIVPVGAVLPLEAGSAGAVLRDEPDVGKRGWAQSVEERERGVASVSAPIRYGHGVAAAVSVSGPIERTSRSPGRRYAPAVMAAARAIEEIMGWKR